MRPEPQAVPQQCPLPTTRRDRPGPTGGHGCELSRSVTSASTADAAAAWGAKPGITMIKMTMTVTEGHQGHQGHNGTSNSRAALRRLTGMSAPFGTSNGLCTHSRWLSVGAYT